MISFYPGPSRVHDEIPKWVKDAHRLGILSMNHRSSEFVAISNRTVKLLRSKLRIPANFMVYFISSATECWEIIAQSLIQESSAHVYNGAFGEKWFAYTRRLKPGARAVSFQPQESPEVNQLIFPDAEVVCLTQNETSNGTQVSMDQIRSIQKSNPAALIAVDATSSMAGISLDFKSADIWFASVQKCFGLPAGLALMCCSAKARERMTKLGEAAHYNSLTFIDKMMQSGQTSFTPNVMGIYLLMRSLEKSKPIRQVDAIIRKRSALWENFFENAENLTLYIPNAKVRSKTVITLTGSAGTIARAKRKAKQKNMLLGEGYGDLKKTTLRIANFPALKDKEIQSLMKILKPLR